MTEEQHTVMLPGIRSGAEVTQKLQGIGDYGMGIIEVAYR